jgi:hypothetical protein
MPAMGLFSFLGGLAGGSSAKKASRAAEAAQLGYLDSALGETRRQFDITHEDFAPYQETGTEALGQQGDLLGLNGPEAQAAAIARLQESPMYGSLYRTGEEAVLQNASATGGLRGGNTQRGLADFGADTLSRVILEQLQQLGGLSGRGMQAVGNEGALGANNAAQIAQLLGQQGQVRSGGLLTRGGINSGMWGNAGSFLDSLNPVKLLAGAF